MSILDQSASIGASTIDPIAATLANPFNEGVQPTKLFPQDFADGFQIIEYINGVAQTGANGFPPIYLVGNMMPMQPFPWQREQKLVKEYYPGNPEANVQVLGGQQPPLVIKGRFKDKKYKTTSYYGVSYIMSQALDAMCDRGNLLKFGMSGTVGSWWRYGFLEKTDWKLNKLSWINYELTFQIVSDKQPKNGYFAAPEKQAPNQVNNNLIAAAASYQSTYSSVPTSMPQSIAGVINGIVNSLAKNINLVTNFVQTVVTTASDIEASANRALGLIKNAQANISSFSRQIDSITHTYANYSSQGAAAGQASDFYANAQYILEAQAGTNQMAQYLASMAALFAAISQTIPKARYRVKINDTLQNISIRFYGVSDYWTNIYDHNQLQTTALTAGTILEIPNL